MMKLFKLGLSALCAAALLAVVGCHKEAPAPTVPEINGVKVDLPKLKTTFESATGEVQQHVTDAIQGVRYRMYDRSLEALDALSNDPNITPDQKKVVGELIDAMKQVLAKEPPPAQ